jgi:N-acyl-D-amino-acid deacylase
MVADLVIRGGMVVDGTGGPRFEADVAVAGSHIVGIGRGLEGDSALDARGCVVSPGFIDIHTHYDAQVFWDPGLTPSCWHGVTTVVAGNCGFSLAPLRPTHRDLMIETLQNVEDMVPATLRAGVDWDSFETFGEYLDAVEHRGVRINFGGFVGHTAVRLYVLGDQASDRPATPEEVDAMRRLVADAITAGALGFASSSSPGHRGPGGRPVASRLGDLQEVLALVEPLRDADRGVVSILPGELVTIPDVYAIQRHACRPLTWTPMLVMPGFPHEQYLEANDKARSQGQPVWAQTAVRPIVFQESLKNPFTLGRFAAFAELTGVDPEQRMAAYRNEAWRDRLSSDEITQPNWTLVTVALSPTHPEVEGRSLADIANERDRTPLETMIDLALSEDLETRFNFPVANFDPVAVGPLLQAEGVLLGLGDGGAHVGQLCDACFPTTLLGTWCRDRGALSLEAAVHKLTGEPAGFLGLTDRGRIEVGQAADICVFDPQMVDSGSLSRVRDFPAQGERLVANHGTGIRHVVVNGIPIRLGGADVDPDARPGVVLRSGQTTSQPDRPRVRASANNDVRGQIEPTGGARQ